jgi:putative tryptophan/tyrosine transport system substrate-binding protein
LFDVRNEDDIENALDRARREHIGALLIGADGLTQMNLSKIVERIARSRIPAAYPSREFVEAGGLFAYAVNYPALYFRFATYVDRILKGARPGDLPVEQPAKFELVINARTARSLGIAVPRALQIRADAVIE